MAEKHLETEVDSCGSIFVDNLQKEEVNSTTRATKRRSSENIAPPPKSPRTDIPSPDADGRPETDKHELQSESTGEQTRSSPPERRKSWRRATLSRRSLPALPNSCQVLCRSVSTSLSQEERLEKLMEASMRMAIQRTENALQTAANSSLDAFSAKVAQMLKEWKNLAKSIQSEFYGLHANGDAASNPPVQTVVGNIMEALNRLEVESESWVTLLNKHKNKGEQLKRNVLKGQETSITPESTSVALSSQYQVIQNKPNYNNVLSRHQPTLQTMALILDTQCKMVRNLLSIREQAQLVVKETSGQLAAEFGIQELSSDLVKNLCL